MSEILQKRCLLAGVANLQRSVAFAAKLHTGILSDASGFRDVCCLDM